MQKQPSIIGCHYTEQPNFLDAVVDRSGILDRVLEQPLPVSGIVRRPTHLLPSRWEVVTYLEQRHRFIPLPETDIEYGTIFYKCRVPLSGRLFVDCHFVGVTFDPPNKEWAAIGCMSDGDSHYWAAQRFKNGTVIGCVGRDFNGR